MEPKAKSGAPMPKGVPKAEKEPVTPRKPDPALAAPEVENPPPLLQHQAAEQEAAPEGGEEEVAVSTDSLESLKPLLIGGAIIAAGAILLGVLLLARRN